MRKGNCKPAVQCLHHCYMIVSIMLSDWKQSKTYPHFSHGSICSVCTQSGTKSPHLKGQVSMILMTRNPWTIIGPAGPAVNELIRASLNNISAMRSLH